MNGAQVYLLRKSFNSLEKQAHVAALAFYRRLFALDPSLRPLFKSDIEAQAKKFMEMLAFTLSMSERPDALALELRELGARHIAYGVRAQYYETVGKALIDMLTEVLAGDFTPAVREAWTEFYRFMTEAMKQGAAQATVLR